MSHALLVADDPSHAEAVQRLVDGQDDLSVEIMAGLDAVPGRLAQGGIDVVLFDAGGAAPPSLEGLAGISSGGADVPVIVLYDAQDGGGAGGDVERRAVEAGAGDALAWGDLTPALLRRAVRYCIEGAQSRRNLAQLALIDGDTGLARSPLYWEILSLAVRRARRNQDFLAVLAVHLDNVDKAADPRAALREAAQRLSSLLRASDTVSRFDGDVLMVLVESMPRVEDIQTVAEKIIEKVSEPMAIDGASIEITPSVGISMFPTVSVSAEGLVGDATGAMSAAVEDGGAIFKFA